VRLVNEIPVGKYPEKEEKKSAKKERPWHD
jgi:hypothetical protein